jgi:uncharacterized protein DUF4386
MKSLKQTARLAGLLWLLAALSAGFGLLYIRSKLIVSADAVATAQNILNFESLFRAGIVSSVLGQIFFFFLAVTVWRLFAEVNRSWALTCIGALLISVALGVMNILNNLAAIVVLTNPDNVRAFTPQQLSAQAIVFLRLNNYGIGLVEVFTGIFLFSFGWLIVKSRYLPRILGILLMIGACAFPVNTLSKILFPGFYPALITRMTMFLNAVGSPLTILWLLIKGVRTDRQTEA